MTGWGCHTSGANQYETQRLLEGELTARVLGGGPAASAATTAADVMAAVAAGCPYAMRLAADKSLPTNKSLECTRMPEGR